MDYTIQNGSQADSTSLQIAAPAINTSQFRTFDFGGENTFRVDSSRIVAKPVAPIIKTVPYVPENDTISHPEYDVLTGEFVIQPDNSMASQLRLNPITPTDATAPAPRIEQTQVTAPLTKSEPNVTEQRTIPVTSSQVLADANADTNVAPTDTMANAVETVADTVTAVPNTVATAITDSTVAAIEQPATQIFEEKEGKPINRKLNNFSINRNINDTDWMIGAIIVSFIIFIWARMIYGKFIKMVMQSAVNYFTARRVYSESNAVLGRIFLILNSIYYINASLLICQTFDFYGFEISDYNGFTNFMICIGGLVSFFALRTILLKILEFVFDAKAFGEYNFSIYLYNKAFGMLLLPVVSVIPFVPAFVAEKLIWIGFGLYALSYLLTLFRGLRICIKNRFSLFYLFFYLCALEILPITVVCKLVIDYCL